MILIQRHPLGLQFVGFAPDEFEVIGISLVLRGLVLAAEVCRKSGSRTFAFLSLELHLTDLTLQNRSIAPQSLDSHLTGLGIVLGDGKVGTDLLEMPHGHHEIGGLLGG